MGVRGSTQFTSASALLGYIIGVSIQNAANGRMLDPPVERAEFLAGLKLILAGMAPSRR